MCQRVEHSQSLIWSAYYPYDDQRLFVLVFTEQKNLCELLKETKERYSITLKRGGGFQGLSGPDEGPGVLMYPVSPPFLDLDQLGSWLCLSPSEVAPNKKISRKNLSPIFGALRLPF